MLPIKLSFRLIDGLASPDRRAIGFLEGHNELNAANEFGRLSGKDKCRLRALGMDRWCDGQPGPKRYFHGWNEPGYRECMVFRLYDHRFYGFKYHPLPISNPALQLCVLSIHVYKRETETDDAELDRVNQWRTNPRAIAAIAQVYPEHGRGICNKLSRN